MHFSCHGLKGCLVLVQTVLGMEILNLPSKITNGTEGNVENQNCKQTRVLVYHFQMELILLYIDLWGEADPCELYCVLLLVYETSSAV